MINLLKEISTYMTNILMLLATSLMALFTYLLWKESNKQRIALQRPYLVPTRIVKTIDASNSLFTANFDYPPTGDYKFGSVFYSGVKNIGTGSAYHVKIIRFKSFKDTEISARVGFVDIAPKETIPLVIRFGYNEKTDLYYATHQVLISYFDSLGKQYYLNLDIWLRESEKSSFSNAVIVRYSDCEEDFEEIPVTVSRFMEWKGYFEIESIKEKEKI
ncbi:MAG: hypothetical protein NT145_03765 [Elusimicrobia bacterium]|nr:hypothetical protein [Elusimicrobiota bacterium]